ncbi:hypothetical protein D5086_027059 [Populus alba]|uniref:Uncharacterized protein n=1 Tax=Populus alba TaxID=43335 RepID=A0ACC4B3M7_POPAL
MHISISLSKCAPFVHAPASHEHSLFKDNRPLICKRRVGRTFSMDIEESLVYVPPTEEVYEDVSPIKEKNSFIPLVEDTRRMAIRGDRPSISGGALDLSRITMVMEITL